MYLDFFEEACLGCVWRCHVMFSSCQQYYFISNYFIVSFLYLCCWLHLIKLTAENWLNLNFGNVEPYMIISNLIIPRDRDFRHGQAASWPMRRVVSNILYFTILDDSLFVHHTTALRHAAAAAHAQCSAALLLPNRPRMFEEHRLGVDSVTCALGRWYQARRHGDSWFARWSWRHSFLLAFLHQVSRMCRKLNKFPRNCGFHDMHNDAKFWDFLRHVPRQGKEQSQGCHTAHHINLYSIYLYP